MEQLKIFSDQRLIEKGKWKIWCDGLAESKNYLSFCILEGVEDGDIFSGVKVWKLEA